MLNDFLPIKVQFDEKKYKELTIVPLGDVHYGSKEFNSVRWHKAVKRIQDDPNCYCVLLGDMIDNGLKNSLTNVYEQTATPREQKEWITAELTPIKDKILAAVGGNHERRSVRETSFDVMFDIMVRLGIEDRYRQGIAFLSVSFSNFKKTGEKKARTYYHFAITHGAGGGQSPTSIGNRLLNFGLSLNGVDCLIVGHTHKPLTFPASRLVFDTRNRFIEVEKFTVVVAQSFLDYGGYPVEKMLLPSAHVLTEIRIKCIMTDDRPKELTVIQ